GIGMLTLILGLLGMRSPSVLSFGILGLEVIIFFAAILIIGPFISRMALKFGNHLDLRVKEGHLSMILITLFALTFIAHSIGLSIIIGAFLAGVVFDKSHIKKIEHEIYSMTYGLFIPIFFIFVGSFLIPSVLLNSWQSVLLILLVALAGKFIGSSLGSVISGMSLKNSALIGVGMMGRCEVALILAIMARGMNIFSGEIYTIIVSSIILTVIITPILFRFLLKKGSLK
ncbi:MAG: cation:proton antiporter, partial [archaeon]